jgi:multisubunit Na+/H+ antiporter MnhC subunit
MKYRLLLIIFLKDGRLTGWGIGCLLIIGIFLSYVSLMCLPSKLLKVIGLSIGLAIMGIGGYSARAAAVDLPPPFTNDPLGWRKAKQTYKSDEESSTSEQKDSQP